MPAARALDDRTLENNLYTFLTTVGKILSLDEAIEDLPIFEENIEASREHGQSRAKIPFYTLDQVIYEFRIFRTLIFRVLEEDGPLPKIERDKIFFAIDNGLTQAATEFAVLRGFKDARLTEEITAKNLALDQAKNLIDDQKLREIFFSTVTHDMKNPLSVARASAEMLSKKSSDPAVVQKYALKIMSSIDRSILMIRDLLDVHRLRSGGKLSLQKMHCDLSVIVRETFEDLSDVYGPRFRIHSLSTVEGFFDCQGIKRALENLLTNAIKYGSKDAAVTIALNLTDSEIKIQVHNEGNPIPLKDQSILFEHQHRASADEGSQQGWGIGLTLVKGIAEAHDGKVKVNSSKEEGTTFSIILPRKLLKH